MSLPYSLPDFIKAIGQLLHLELNTKIEDGLVLNIEDTYKIQIEFYEERVLILSNLGEILPSRFRHQVFTDALKSNHTSSCFGTLAYSDKKKALLLVLNYPIIPPKIEEFGPMLEGFMAKAKAWSSALKSSNTRLLV